MCSHALWFGRFQPPSIAHYETMKSILKRWDSLTIAVMEISRSAFHPEWQEYVDGAISKMFAPHRNPFRPVEVKKMWDAVIGDMTVQTVLLPPPQCFDLNGRFPKGEVDYIQVCNQRGDNLDAMRKDIYPALFLKTHNRVLFQIDAPYELHNTEIRKLVAEGSSWENFIAPGAYETFLALNGPTRVEQARKLAA